MLKIIIHEYLKEIAGEEERCLAKDPTRAQQRHIPTIKDMAMATDISAANYYKWAGNRTKNISRLITAKAIFYLRSLGFDTQLIDILRLVPDNEI